MNYSNLWNKTSYSLLRPFIARIRNCSTIVSNKGRPRKGVICQPLISESEAKKSRSIVGLHVGSNYVSWVTVAPMENEVTVMGTSQFPDNFEKMNLSGISAFAFQAVQMLPEANFYIIEELMKAVSGKAGRNQLLFQSSLMQFIAMLVSLINFKASDGEHNNRVLFLKHRLPAKLFGLLVGNEVVSSTKIVNEILSDNSPPRFSPLLCSDSLKSRYFSRSRIEQEIIGYSFMTAITFSELMIRKNKKCLDFLNIANVVSKVQKSKETNDDDI